MNSFDVWLIQGLTVQEINRNGLEEQNCKQVPVFTYIACNRLTSVKSK